MDKDPNRYNISSAELENLNSKATALFFDNDHVIEDTVRLTDTENQVVPLFFLSERDIPTGSDLYNLGIASIAVTFEPAIEVDDEAIPAQTRVTAIRRRAADDPRVYQTNRVYHLVHQPDNSEQLFVSEQISEEPLRLELATKEDALELRSTLQAVHTTLGMG